MTALAAAAWGIASTSPRCQQQLYKPGGPRGFAPVRAQRSAFAGAPLAPQRPSLTAAPRRQAPSAARNIATTGGSSRAAEPSGAAGGGGGGNALLLLQGAWEWLCSIKPPKSLWRTIAAVVLGGQALVRILQGKQTRLHRVATRLLGGGRKGTCWLPRCPSLRLRPGRPRRRGLPVSTLCCRHLPPNGSLLAPPILLPPAPPKPTCSSCLRPDPLLAGKIHWKNTLDQLNMVGPRSLGVCLLTAAFVGMVFTIQFIRCVAWGRGRWWLEHAGQVAAGAGARGARTAARTEAGFSVCRAGCCYVLAFRRLGPCTCFQLKSDHPHALPAAESLPSWG